MTDDARSYITDPKALRALSHPTRWTIIEVLGAERTATATRCAEYSGESVASCSYHLGMLAKYGFVEPVEGADGREKPWRLTRRDQSWRASDLEPDAAMAAETLSEVFIDHERRPRAPLALRLYARLWWASRPRVETWPRALLDA